MRNIFKLVAMVMVVGMFLFIGSSCKAEAAETTAAAAETTAAAAETTAAAAETTAAAAETTAATEPVAETKLVFGVAQPSTIKWYELYNKGFKAYCDEHGIETIFTVTQKPQDGVEQVDLIEQLIAKKVDAIAFSLGDSDVLIAGVKAANEAGIPIADIGSPVNVSVFADISPDVWVDGDNYEPCKQEMLYIADKLGNKGNVVVLSGVPGNPTSIKRNQGCLDGCKEGGLTVLEEQTGNWDMQVSYNVMADLLTKYDKIDAVFGGFDDGAMACYEAAKAVGREKEILFCGADGGLMEKVASGELAATYDMDSANLAYLGAAALHRAVTYKDWQRSWTLVEFTVITPENVEAHLAGMMR
jgi:ABC-type sugar transport system substrate-binding protein